MRRQKGKLYLPFLVIMFLVFGSANAQNHAVFLSRNYNYKFQSHLSKRDVSFHSAIQPYTINDIKKQKIKYEYGKPFQKLNKEVEQENKSRIDFYPLAELGAKVISDIVDTNGFDVGIGVASELKLGNSFNSRVEFSASRFQYPLHIEDEVRSSWTTADGQLWHQYKNGYHTTNLNGFLDYKPGEIFDFRVGHGRIFLGDGYRSLMLSDNAGNYSYGKVSADIWRLKYMVLYAHLREVGSNISRTYNNMDSKFATIHYLSWNVNKWFNVGFFESVVWPGRDTLLDRGFDPNYLNPVIFMRPVEYSLGSSDNSLLGVALNFKPVQKTQIYTQFVLDEFLLDELMQDAKDLVQPDPARRSGWWANKYAIQIGVKTFDAFKVKGLGFQTEMNLVRPFTYSHGNANQNYGHLNRSLAHPLGSNFIESVSFISYQYGNALVEMKFQYFQQGMSSDSTNFGEDVFQPYRSRSSEYGHYLGQGVRRDVAALSLTYNYIIVPETNLRLYFNFIVRDQKYITNRIDFLVTFGVRSSITNRYTDI